MKYFVYLTTNLINGKQYIGDHSSPILEDSYLGGGLKIRAAVKRYGRKNFKREILELFENKGDAFNAQKKYIDKINTLSPNGYNISPTGGIGITGSLSKESLEKISKANKGKKPWLGKTHKEESKKLMREKHIGRPSKNKGISPSDKTKELMSLRASERTGDKNSMFGKQHREKSIEKMIQKAKNRKRIKCKYCGNETTVSMHNRWHGEKCKRKNCYV